MCRRGAGLTQPIQLKKKDQKRRFVSEIELEVAYGKETYMADLLASAVAWGAWPCLMS